MGGAASVTEHRVQPGTTELAPYRYSKPSVTGDAVYGCFTTTTEHGEVLAPPGSLYRIVREQEKQWFFYNDTKTHNMVVTGYFGPHSDIHAVGNAMMWREHPSGALIVEVVVAPLQTEPYLEGNVCNGFDLRFRALPK